MRQTKIAFDLICLALTIPVVILLFRFIPDRKIAATFAGCLFVGVPLLLAARRWKNPFVKKSANILWWAGIAQFLIFFAFPILGARLLFWETPFDEMNFLGVSGPQLHKFSNYSFMLMAALIATAGWVGRLKRTAPAKIPG